MNKTNEMKNKNTLSDFYQKIQVRIWDHSSNSLKEKRIFY